MRGVSLLGAVEIATRLPVKSAIGAWLRKLATAPPASTYPPAKLLVR